MTSTPARRGGGLLLTAACGVPIGALNERQAPASQTPPRGDSAGMKRDLSLVTSETLEFETDDIRHTNAIRLVMKNGEPCERDTLAQVWPPRKTQRPFWWWSAGARDRSAAGSP